jgi:hypothetical protein
VHAEDVEVLQQEHVVPVLLGDLGPVELLQGPDEGVATVVAVQAVAGEGQHRRRRPDDLVQDDHPFRHDQRERRMLDELRRDAPDAVAYGVEHVEVLPREAAHRRSEKCGQQRRRPVILRAGRHAG